MQAQGHWLKKSSDICQCLSAAWTSLSLSRGKKKGKEKDNFPFFLWHFSLGPLWMCESLPVQFGADLCMAPTAAKPGQHLPLESLLGKENSPVQRDETPKNSKHFSEPAATCETWVLQYPAMLRPSQSKCLVLVPLCSLTGVWRGEDIPARAGGGLGAAPLGCSCVLPQLCWLGWVQRAILPWLGTFMSLRGVKRGPQTF